VGQDAHDPFPAADTPPLLAADELAAAHEIHDHHHDRRHAYHQRRGGLDGPDDHWPGLCQNNCGDVSDDLAERFADRGWTVEEGNYVGPGSPAAGSEHTWNRLPDGTVVDATADQCGRETVVVVGPDDPDQEWYEPGEVTGDDDGGLGEGADRSV
jgi:hypothetical protein